MKLDKKNIYIIVSLACLQSEVSSDQYLVAIDQLIIGSKFTNKQMGHLYIYIYTYMYIYIYIQADMFTFIIRYLLYL